MAIRISGSTDLLLGTASVPWNRYKPPDNTPQCVLRLHSFGLALFGILVSSRWAAPPEYSLFLLGMAVALNLGDTGRGRPSNVDVLSIQYAFANRSFFSNGAVFDGPGASLISVWALVYIRNLHINALQTGT